MSTVKEVKGSICLARIDLERLEQAVVPMTGVEPALQAKSDPKSDAYTNFATSAYLELNARIEQAHKYYKCSSCFRTN